MAISGRAFPNNLAVVPTPPRRPGPRARALVLGYGGGRRVLMMVGGFFTALGLLFAIIFAGNIPSDLAIFATGHPVEGRVVSAAVDQSSSVNGSHPVVATFQYDLAGQTYTGHSSALDPGLLALKSGAPVTLEVASLNAGWARLPGTTRSWTGYFGSFVLIFPAVGIGLCLAVIRSRRRALRAFVHGQAIKARVVFLGPDTSVEINGRNPFKLAWEFRADDGLVYDGSLSSMHLLDLEDFADQGEVVVVHDPANPRINTLYVSD